MIKTYKKGSVLTWLIIFGIIYGIRALFETLGLWVVIFRMLNNDLLYFAVMITIYYFLHKPLVRKFAVSESLDKIQSHSFDRILKFFIIASWIVAGLFVSISILQIPMRNPDIFNLSLFWILALLTVCVISTSLINRALSPEKKLAKAILRNSMIVGALGAFGLWSLQLLVFEVYLNRWLRVEIMKQDMRVLVILVLTLYITIFLQTLKTRFLPETKEKSAQKIQKLLEAELNKPTRLNQDTDLQVKSSNNGSSSSIEDEYREIRFPEGISFKAYLFALKKFKKSSLDEESFLNKKTYILGGTFWAISLGSFFIFLYLTRIISNIFIVISSLSLTCSLFMVLGDLSIIFLFNRVNNRGYRTPKEILRKTVLTGSVLTFWVWTVLFFIFYTYLYIGLSDKYLTILVSDRIMSLNIIYAIVFSMVMFIVGTRIIWWYATSIRMWDAALKSAPFVKKKAFRVSLVWLLINLPIRILINLFFVSFSYSSIFNIFFQRRFNTQYTVLFLEFELPIAIINIIIGGLLVSKVYKRRFKESAIFALFTQLILLLISVAMNVILGFFHTLLTTYTFVLNDIRILLVVAAAIYLVSIVATRKITPGIDASEKIKERFRSALQPQEERPVEASTNLNHHVILDVNDLTTYFYTEEGVVRAVEGVSFQIYEGETLGLVGETGCGKSVTALSILRLVRPPGEIKSGKVIFEEEDLHRKSMDDFLKYRGKKISMIFQDPLNSLNPVYKVGDQISEVYLLHMENELLIEAARKNTGIYSVARKWSQRMLKDLNIPVPRVIFDRYPHELSGGMRQRVQIAMGLACSPKLLIADEPTTALDVTIQNQILKLMKELKEKYNTSILFITHDLGIIAKMCDRVAVMYSGFIVEYGEIVKLFRIPYHPYTRGLIASVPVVGKKRELLDVIPGTVPNLIYPPSGCRFHPRCQYCFEPCDSAIPKSIEVEPRYFVACHLYDPDYKDLAQISIDKVERITE
ncbi:MAG: ABC transporter ATP-binding protein [Promethearchaeota archaeon]